MTPALILILALMPTLGTVFMIPAETSIECEREMTKDLSDRKHRTARAHDAPGQFGSKPATSRIAVVTAIALLWCNCALAADARVLLLRGWFGVFSTGLDKLANELRAQGINAEVDGHINWGTKLSELLRERATGKSGPLVLVGHSQGANNVIDIARSLEAHKLPVALLVTLAPFMQNPIPANVERAINYYQSHGWGSPIAPDHGFHGQLFNIDVGNDWSISHISIDKSTRIHTDISAEIAVLYHSNEGKGVSRNLVAPSATSIVGLNR